MAASHDAGTLKSTSINGVKLYSLTGNRYVAPWVLAKKKRALRKDKEYQRRLDLIHDLRFETATTKIKLTPDDQYVIASGIYPPQVKVYELKELSMKFERHMISEIINFQILGDDYSKLAFLCADRSVNLHAKYGSHYSLRIPRMGRDMAYDCWSCDLLCAASSPDLYRINLEQGRFLAALSSQSPAINAVTRSKVHGLVACGGEDGAVECFDMRKRSSVGRINIPAVSSEDYDQEVTSLQFDEDQGYLMAVGSSTGKGSNMTSIEPDGGAINDVCIFRNSGLMLLALDNSQIPAHFIPALGPAPKWCSHLDNLTEEMEEKPDSTVYDEYKFLTKEEMERLNLTQYIGTNAQRREVDPVEHAALIEEMKKKKIDAQRKSRITQVVKIPKVNRQLLDSIIEEERNADMENADKSSKKKRERRLKGYKDLLEDERFKEMFENKDFQIDEQSKEYLALHPQAATKEPRLIEEHFESVSEDEKQSDASASDASGMSDSDNDMHNSKRIRLYEVKDERHAEAFLNSVSLSNEDAVPLEDRIAALEKKQNSKALDAVKYGPGGSREISFISRSGRRHKEELPSDDEGPKDFKRRGVQSLGLKQGKAEFYMFGGNRGRGRGGARGRGGRGRGGRGRGRG